MIREVARRSEPGSSAMRCSAHGSESRGTYARGRRMVKWLKNRLTRRGRLRPMLSSQHDDIAPREATAADHFRMLRQSRQLCAAIDRGAELNLWNHVDRLSESAARLSWFDAPLAERLAKVKVAHGDPETALAMLDRGVNSPASSRLLRIMCLLHTGARTPAHLELMDWSREGSGAGTAPSELPGVARLLLALLEWHAGDIESATHLLHDVAHDTDEELMRWAQMTLVLLAAARGQWDRATTKAEALAESPCGLFDPEIALMLDSLRLGRPIDPEQQRQERIAQMANELPGSAHLIEPLVEAQRRHFETPVAEELYEALERALAHMGEHQAIAVENLARLAALLGDAEAAIRWARRGLALNPMSARLALLLNELTSEELSDEKEHAA